MNKKGFSADLKRLMKERKVSGAKIGKVVGVSQKTISRYVTGEKEADDMMKKKILKAIAEIGGHPEDADMGIQQCVLSHTLEELDKHKDMMPSDDEILEKELQEIEKDREEACKVFSLLNERNQMFVLENFKIFSDINLYEIAIVKAFTVISEDKKRWILEGLETLHLNLSALKNNPQVCRKISRYMEMISKCKETTEEDFDKFQNMPKDIMYSPYVEEYVEKLNSVSGSVAEKMATFLPELITLDSRDWYLMMLVQTVNLNDRGGNPCYGSMVGDRMFALVNLIEKLENEN